MEGKPGDKVRIVTLKEEINGILLESPNPDIALVKLDSGYNIGVVKENIKHFEIVEKFKIAETNEGYKMSENNGLPKIDVIMTGGTIASRLDTKTGAVKWLTKPEEFFQFYPELFEIVNVKNVKNPFLMASEDMSASQWIEIARVVEESLKDNEVSGVIVTHGTDFLGYTAAAFSFFLGKLNKPVVLTYSQRSSDRASSDASLNMLCAGQAAISDIAEVMIVGHGSINDDFCFALRGVKARKMHTSRRDTFRPINASPIAKIWPGKIEIIGGFRKKNEGKIDSDIVFNEKVALVKFYPGMNPDILDYYNQYFEGIVLEVSGLGHLSVEGKYNWIPKIKKAIDNGLVICAAPQTLYGQLDPLVYSPGRALMDAGVIYLEDMLPETALVKLGWVLGHKQWKLKVKEKMLENFAGEFNKRLGVEFC
ncbi:MAG: Glu-tRNA(Gln) amidotransferase subunit GatD [Nanoarchaeota archaeon]